MIALKIAFISSLLNVSGHKKEKNVKVRKKASIKNSFKPSEEEFERS
jgi:hypothetical protein